MIILSHMDVDINTARAGTVDMFDSKVSQRGTQRFTEMEGPDEGVCAEYNGLPGAVPPEE